MRIAIIGAGPAGITAAYALARRMGESSVTALEVYEAGPEVGGLARSMELWGQIVDLGPHRFFSHDTRINRLWLEVAGGSYDLIDRQTRIYYQGRFFDYPLKPRNAFVNLGPREAARCLASYVRERLAPHPREDTFESWVVSRFGRRLYEIFFKTYSEKLWGIPCHELDSDFAAQRIKKLSLSEAIKSALRGNRGNRHKTLVDQFAYPLEGTGSIYREMARRVRAAGGSIHLNRPVEQVVTAGGRVRALRLADGETVPCDAVLSSMPLSLLVERLPEAPAEVVRAARSLRFRNTILVYLRVEGPALFPDQWLYVHSPTLRTGRITNFRNWLPSLHRGQSASILCLEYWCDFEDPVWREPDDSLVATATAEIGQTGLLGAGEVTAGHVHRIPRCYPVYFAGYKRTLAPIEQYLRGVDGLQVIGRYGAYKYNNQDHSLLMGLLAAENLLDRAGHDLWAVNTDYDSYQESSVITRTGLEKR